MTIGDLNGDGERDFGEGVALAGYLTDVDGYYTAKYGDGGGGGGCGSMGCGCVLMLLVPWLLGELIWHILGF